MGAAMGVAMQAYGGGMAQAVQAGGCAMPFKRLLSSGEETRSSCTTSSLQAGGYAMPSAADIAIAQNYYAIQQQQQQQQQHHQQPY
jgi:hypothetical protein